MAQIIDDTPWFEDISQKVSDGWVLQLGSTAVDQLSLNDGLVIHLDNGIDLVVTDAFRLLSNGKIFPVYLEELTGGAVTNKLIYQSVRKAFATNEGTLEVTFNRVTLEELTLVVRSPSWRITFPDGSMCYGLREGGIGMLPPRHFSPRS